MCQPPALPSPDRHFHILLVGTYPEVWLCDLLNESAAVRAVAALNTRFGNPATGRAFEVSTERGAAVAGWQDMTRETWHAMRDVIDEAVQVQPDLLAART